MAVSGMTSILLDSTGRMIEFQAVPPQVSADDDGTPPAPAWKALFDARRPRHVDVHAGDTAVVAAGFRRHSSGVGGAAHRSSRLQRCESRRLRIAAGRPRCCCSASWSRPTAHGARSRARPSQVRWSAVVSLLIIALTVAGLMLARFNLRAGRRAIAGAPRASHCSSWWAMRSCLSSRHITSSDVSAEIEPVHQELRRCPDRCRHAVVIVYLALEPHVRRLRPDGILGWTRLLGLHSRSTRGTGSADRLRDRHGIGPAGEVQRHRAAAVRLSGSTAHISRHRNPGGCGSDSDFIWSAVHQQHRRRGLPSCSGTVVLRLTLRRTSSGRRRGGDPAGDRSGTPQALTRRYRLVDLPRLNRPSSSPPPPPWSCATACS